MNEYTFTLKFTLPDPGSDPDDYLDALFTAGCDDALVGVGQHRSIGLDFAREAKDAEQAICSAISNVQKAIPGSQLIEVSPDLVGLTDIAELFGCSRQNIRKIVTGPKSTFPLPAHTGGHTSLWHVTDILKWADSHDQTLNVSDPALLYEVSIASANINVTQQFKRYAKQPLKTIRAKSLKRHTISKRKLSSKQASIASRS